MLQYQAITQDIADSQAALASRDSMYQGLTMQGLGNLKNIYHIFSNVSLAVLAADYGMGLDHFLISLAIDRAVCEHIPTAMILAEHSRVEAMDAILANLCNERQALALSPLHLLDGIDITIDEVCNQISHFFIQYGVRLFIIDNLQWLRVVDVPIFNSRIKAVIAARRLKNLAISLGVSIILATTLTDSLANTLGADNKQPQVKHIPGGPALVAVSDAMAFLCRLEYYNIYCTPDGEDIRGTVELRTEKIFTNLTLKKRLGYIQECCWFYDLPN